MPPIDAATGPTNIGRTAKGTWTTTPRTYTTSAPVFQRPYRPPSGAKKASTSYRPPRIMK
jgi:hypothetical protein